MGRNRSFDEATVVTAASTAFCEGGYEATSIDDLVRCTGLHRGSLYQAFGSKRGLFLLALRRTVSQLTSESWTTTPVELDLVLVALLELAPRDRAVGHLLDDALRHAPVSDVAQVLGQRLIDRAALDSDQPANVSTLASGEHHREEPV